MTRTVLQLLAMTVLSVSAADAQDISGFWQGMLRLAQADEQRVLVRISDLENGDPSATVLYVDVPGLGYAGNPVALEDGRVTIAIRRLGLRFEGRLTGDGNSIEGGFADPRGFGLPTPMRLSRPTLETRWVLPAAPRSMAEDADPAFETASVVPGGPDRPAFIMRMAGQFQSASTSLADLIRVAYQVHDAQIEGGPAWLRTEAFTVEARSPAGAGEPSPAQLRSMIRKLLADRFALELHSESRELPVYTIRVGQSGPRMQTAIDPSFAAVPPLPGAWAAMNLSMEQMAAMLSIYALDRPVIDQTGLSGSFDFTLLWNPDESRFAGGRLEEARRRLASIIADAPDLPTALREQLGLDFESTTEAVPVLVIDHAERPSP